MHNLARWKGVVSPNLGNVPVIASMMREEGRIHIPEYGAK